MATCVSCKELLVFVDADPETAADEEIIPDDLLLPQCLLDEAAQVATSFSCPSCRTNLSATPPPAASSSSSSSLLPPSGVQILTRYVNEGGLQENYDIYPDLAEEAYLQVHPEARPARAFLTMCAAGDVMGIVGLFSEDEEDETEEDEQDSTSKLSPELLLRYQDPLGRLQSGLHLAVEKEQEEVLYLLLFLSSQLPLDAFPPAVLQSAEQIGLVRPPSISSHADIRTLQDQGGETAAMYASRKGGQWAAIAQTGLLSA
ncbi:hypothetical protein CMQ_5591 [Grosmannia clavigera kw1407]|uniref:Uncharacterized protein n=1 Tax=Grosmannia clavigera (strain kw1407 / UAMH 11150) TaxID=655863 RepID=F0XSH2_GROCL|nr:uncharacterized protein CMQ_5591 [Grosmannia clavigera kw1407]EFW99170.1 hypothetical protein CMQ_5591 [Grosmannia clavigera kw1407]